MLDQYLTSMGVSSLGLHLFLLFWGPTSKALQLNSGWKLVTSPDADPNATTVGPGPRAGAALWPDSAGHAWLFGGRGPAAANATQLWADLWLYDAQLQIWQRRIPHANDSVAGRELAAICGSPDGTLAIFGGHTSDGSASAELLIAGPGEPHLQRRMCSGACPAGRYDALAWCDSSAMHVAGGIGDDGCPLADAWSLDLRTLAWAAAKPPPTRCRWAEPSDCNATTPPMQLWHTPGGALYIMCEENTVNATTNVQLWTRSAAGSWRLEAESGTGIITWPGPRSHGGACVDAGGDLWLFGGQSAIGELRYMNNDVWTYSVEGRAWLKTELPSDADEPAQRHLAASFCGAGAMWVLGGSACYDTAADCLLGDAWMLNVSRSAAPPKAGLIADAGGLLRSEVPSVHEHANAPEGLGLDHGAYGSVIFFGISLSMFAVFGLVLFIRRCVSCPPRDGGLLKEAPPVRYTVIPDDAYSI